MNTNAKAAAPAIFSVEKMSEMLRQSPAGPYGFVVSQQVYDGLRDQIPQAFAGGNSFASVPIVVDPDLAPGEVDVAFNAKGWRERLEKIKPR
jgi:hypothetical protein